MEKEKKHLKADIFRKEIASTANRKQFIKSLLIKDAFDESDRLRITILFQKAAYLLGCEDAYAALVKKINHLGDQTLIDKTTQFSKKLNLTLSVCQHY